jgi:hypothetical protein
MRYFEEGKHFDRARKCLSDFVCRAPSPGPSADAATTPRAARPFRAPPAAAATSTSTRTRREVFRRGPAAVRRFLTHPSPAQTGRRQGIRPTSEQRPTTRSVQAGITVCFLAGERSTAEFTSRVAGARSAVIPSPTGRQVGRAGVGRCSPAREPGRCTDIEIRVGANPPALRAPVSGPVGQLTVMRVGRDFRAVYSKPGARPWPHSRSTGRTPPSTLS